MRFLGNFLQINAFIELHVLRVNAQYLQASDFIRNADVDFAIKAAETTKSRVNRVRSVRRTHHDDVRARLHAIHQGQELRHDATLDFTIRLFTLRSDGINFIDKDDRRSVLLSLLKRLT